MEKARDDDFEFLSNLEERIRKAVDVVAALRKENESLVDKLQEAVAAREAAEKLAAKSSEGTAALRQEIESLQAERKQVRSRIEKLLGQMDALSAS
ncbi:MAG: cell division protein ZapB [Bryobacteraceae bacterium]|nr:cell division protein ZapB [Bryobacteraceae bacterium]